MPLTLEHAMTNAELQEAITMANAMVKSAAPNSPNFKDLQDHLSTLLKLQQMRASTWFMPDAVVTCGVDVGADRLSVTLPGAKMDDAAQLPLCDCADKGAHCLGRQPGKACMAHDKWYVQPCDEGKCPGPFSPRCCHKPHPDEHLNEQG